MQFTAAQLAQFINATIQGESTIQVSSFGKIEEATPGQLSFLANPKYEEYLYTTNASIIIINADYVLKQPVAATLLKVPNAYTAFATLLNIYQQLEKDQQVGIEQPSYIHASSTIGLHAYVGAFAYIGKQVIVGNHCKIYPHTYIGNNVTIGNHVTLQAGVKIYDNCVLGNHITIHSGTVIGSDGFGFAPQPDGTYVKVPQIGNVVIQDHVEIGANAAIDRATIGSTLIKSGAKLDNLIQIAHNVEVGNQTVIAAQVGISGSTKLGNNVMIGGQAGIVGHIHLADGTRVNAQSGVSKSTKPNAALTGSPAGDFTHMLRSQAIAKRLPELELRIKALEQALAAK